MWHVQPAAAYGSSRQQRVDVIIPDDGLQRSLVTIFAGSWWQTSARLECRHLAWDLANHGQAVAVVDVRQKKERGVNDFSDLLADAEAGLQRAQEEAMLLGWEANKIILLGWGSGSLTAFYLAKRLLLSDAQQQQALRGVIAAGLTPSLSPWENIPGEVSQILADLQSAETDDLWAQDLNWPDMLILHGDQDKIVPATVARAFYREANDHGAHARYGLLNGTGHEIFTTPGNRTYQSAFDDLIDWLGH